MNNNENNEDVFEIAAKAHKLLQEILSSNKTSSNKLIQQQQQTTVKQEPIVHAVPPTYQYHHHQQYYQQQQQQQQTPFQVLTTNLPQQFIYPTSSPAVSSISNSFPNFDFYIHHPPPIIPSQYYYQQQQPQQQQQQPNYYHSYNHVPASSTTSTPVVQMQQQMHHHHYYNQQQQQQNMYQTHPYYRTKRKFNEINNNNHPYQSSPLPTKQMNNYFTKSTYSAPPMLIQSNEANNTDLSNSNNNNAVNEEEDLNLMRERELKELKSKSIVEKMSVFLKYYKQFRDAYINRVQLIECSDSLKIQFHALIKYLSEYECLLAELNMMITEHERDQCKNNHRKTKKFFNKTKAFIRYECNKRLQSNIFEYRRLINSTDRYAGMYDLLDMNSYLISLLPDIGVSIRRYINRCERARDQEKFEDEEEEYNNNNHCWMSEENSVDSVTLNETSLIFSDAKSFKLPTFKEFVALENGDFDEEEEEFEDDDDDDDDDDLDDEDEEDDLDDEELDLEDQNNILKENKRKRKKLLNETNLPTQVPLPSTSTSKTAQTTNTYYVSHLKAFDSFSKGIDSLNRYLLKRVDEEESLDELVKERIIKWINKRQSKYILIFSEVDKLLNQHLAGECYSKFHSYLLFNLGKLVTVCDSYHQKLKELLYSTTIRRKKKRKKVKLLPESMADVFNEIIDLKRALEHAKITIKRCNLNSMNKEIVKQF